MIVVAFEDDNIRHFRPLVDTRAVYDLLIGIRTTFETIEDSFPGFEIRAHVRKNLEEIAREEHPGVSVNELPETGGAVFINGRSAVESGEFVRQLRTLAENRERSRVFVRDDTVVAAWVQDVSRLPELGDYVSAEYFDGLPIEEPSSEIRLYRRLWHLVGDLSNAIARDYSSRTGNQKADGDNETIVQAGALLVNPEQIFLGPGAVIRAGAILNAENGPIYIDRGSVVMEGAIARGPMYLGPHAHMKMGVRAELASVGAHGKIGGEVRESIIHSYSNKAHDGYLGNSYIGRWCNIGADSNTSNLKNDYSNVTLFNMSTREYEDSERMFVGTYMGDHSKCGINTMFNTGTVVGVSCNIFGSGFPSRFIRSFSWGGQSKMDDYQLQKALQVAEAMMARRNVTFTRANRLMLTRLRNEAVSGNGELFLSNGDAAYQPA